MSIVFVSDAFADQFRGGAELTTNAVIQSCPYEFVRVNSSLVTTDMVMKYKDDTWIIGNFTALDDKVKIALCKNVNYSIIEYDYKFCKYRSMEKHFFLEKEVCNCIDQPNAKINKIFYGYANRVWFMSEKQKDIFLENVSTIKTEKCETLSSLFSEGDLRFMNSIKDNKKNDKYLILKSHSWIKNTQETIQYAKDNNLSYELVSDLPYHELLIKMSTFKGLIFMPSGGDTCPRIVIEAKLLNCDLIINDNVQHKDEDWFTGSRKDCCEYLKQRTSKFWSYYE
jgi:hypothetical protein